MPQNHKHNTSFSFWIFTFFLFKGSLCPVFEMNNHDAAKLSMSQATVHLCPSIFLSTLIMLTLSSKKIPPNLESQKTNEYLFLILCYVSSTALTTALTTQTHLHFPSCSPILCFPSFLSPSSTCFSIHSWHPSTQSTKLWKTNSYPKTNQLIKDYFLILTLL